MERITQTGDSSRKQENMLICRRFWGELPQCFQVNRKQMLYAVHKAFILTVRFV